MNNPSKKTLANRNLSGTVRSKDAVNGQSKIMFSRSFVNISRLTIADFIDFVPCCQ